MTADGRKIVAIYIGNTAGGTYEPHGRAGRAPPRRYLPGHPTDIAREYAGRRPRLAPPITSHQCRAQERTALGIVSETLASSSAQERRRAVRRRKPDMDRAAAASNAVHIQWHTSKVQSIEDARKFEGQFAEPDPGNVAEIVPTCSTR